MNKNLQNIEDLFYSALNDLEEAPSQNYWEAMDRELDKQKVISIKKGYTYLKKIALMLLLLLISFSLFEINNIQHNKRLAKNNNLDSGKLPESNIINNKMAKGKVTTDSAIAIGSIHTKGYKKENTVSKNSIGENNRTNLPAATSLNNDYGQHRKKKVLTIAVAKENASEPSKNHNPVYKENPTGQLAFQARIKNSKAIKDEKSEVGNKEERIQNQISNFKITKDKLIEDFKLQLKDSITSINSLKSKIVVGSNVGNKSKNEINEKKYNEVKASALSIMPFYSPDIAWYRLQNDNLNYQSSNAGEFETKEKHEFSSTYGLLLDYNLNKHWTLQTGITLSNINISINPETLYAQPDNTGSIKYRINTSSGYGFVLPSFSSNPVIGDSLYAISSIHSLQYIGVPIAVTYHFTFGKFKLNVVEGIAANLLSESKLETNLENGSQNSIESTNKIQGLKNIYFSGLTGLNVDLRITKRTGISITPTIRYALNSINKNTLVKSYPMSFGSVVGLKIGL